jgi:hypothetical protein
MQDGAPIAYYSQKLTNSQQNHTTMEKELLSIYETLKEFCSMLLGAEINIFTDQKNVTYSSTVNQQVIFQLNYLEEYLPTYHHISDRHNFLADAFSHLPCCKNIDYPSGEEKEWLSKVKLDSFHTSIFNDPQLINFFLNLADLNYEPFLLDFQHIAQGQQADQLLLQQQMLHLLQYPSQYFQGMELMSCSMENMLFHKPVTHAHALVSSGFRASRNLLTT